MSNHLLLSKASDGRDLNSHGTLSGHWLKANLKAIHGA